MERTWRDDATSALECGLSWLDLLLAEQYLKAALERLRLEKSAQLTRPDQAQDGRSVQADEHGHKGALCQRLTSSTFKTGSGWTS